MNRTMRLAALALVLGHAPAQAFYTECTVRKNVEAKMRPTKEEEE